MTVIWSLKACLLRWAHSHGNMEGTTAEERIDETCFISNKYDWRGYALHTLIPRQRIQKRFHSHGSEPPKHSNSKEHDNSTAEGGDLHMVQSEPMSGTELTNRRENTTEHRRRSQKSEVKSLVYVVSSWFIVTKCYSYSKIVLQLIVVLPVKYSINQFVSNPEPINCLSCYQDTRGVIKCMH
jgi:hypothetical protein